MMTIDYRFGDLDAHGVTIRAQAMALEAEHQVMIGDVLAAGDLWGRAGSCRRFTADLGRNFQVVYQQANAHGARVLTAGGSRSTRSSVPTFKWSTRAKRSLPLTASCSTHPPIATRDRRSSHEHRHDSHHHRRAGRVRDRGDHRTKRA